MPVLVKRRVLPDCGPLLLVFKVKLSWMHLILRHHFRRILAGDHSEALCNVKGQAALGACQNERRAPMTIDPQAWQV